MNRALRPPGELTWVHYRSRARGRLPCANEIEYLFRWPIGAGGSPCTFISMCCHGYRGSIKTLTFYCDQLRHSLATIEMPNVYDKMVRLPVRKFLQRIFTLRSGISLGAMDYSGTELGGAAVGIGGAATDGLVALVAARAASVAAEAA